MNLLKNKRIDFALIDDEDFYRVKISAEFSELKALKVPFDQEPNYLAFSKKRGHQQLAQRFAAAMAEFKDSDQYQQLQQRYSEILSAATEPECEIKLAALSVC